jgi:hypothetical protein
MRYHLLTILCCALLAVSCATTEPTSDDNESESSNLTGDLADDYIDASLSETERLLLRTRSQLTNHYSEDMVHVPDLYMQEIIVDERQSDPYAGFRVQLLSTRNVAEADSVRDYFVAWADSVIAGYEPDAYVVFRSPNYRVRAGDFQDRDKAIHFSGMLKSRYPDAWVVHERIEPSKVPSDTTEVSFKDLKAFEFEEEMRMMESADSSSVDR